MLITDINQLTPDHLTEILRGQGLLSSVSVSAIHPKSPLTGNSLIIPLEVVYSGETDAPTRMILKLPGIKRPNDGRREVEFHTHIIGENLPVIRCYDAVYSQQDGRFHLLTEDLSATHDSHPPSFLPSTIPNAERIVDALAQVHAYWWDHPKLGNGIGQLHTADSIHEQTAADTKNVIAFLQFFVDSFDQSGDIVRIYEALLELVEGLRMRWLLSKTNFTLIHDNLHDGSFLYPYDPQKDTLRIIDWKSWSMKPGPADMANMMIMYWPHERRLQLQDLLLRRYHARLLEYGVTGYDWDNCWNDYRMAFVDLLFFPVRQWSVGIPEKIWWRNLHRLITVSSEFA